MPLRDDGVGLPPPSSEDQRESRKCLQLDLGVGMALRKVGAMAKPDCIITSDGKNLSIKTESTLKTTQFSCKLGEKFEETTADGRKTQTVCNFTDGSLVQHQEWDGKESTITRKLEDGKLVVVCVMNNIAFNNLYHKQLNYFKMLV
uniref:Lipocalin/cytosolic fatty-acid binding domain-containing protein n=1 Tax=Capra hircus TaxID=9925 RepID=A0A8C2SDX5_CAPHI